MRFNIFIGLLSASIFLSGTSVAEELRSSAMPSSWQYYDNGYSQTFPDEDSWWKGFNDPVLDSLITLGVKNNYNLSEAAHRMAISRQEMRMSQSGYYPVIGLDTGWNASRTSGNMTSHSIPPANTSYFSAGLNMSWEIDIFGRISAQSKQKKNLWQASRAEYAAAMVALCANIADTYVQLRAAQTRLQIAQKHLQSQDKVLKITQARYESGLSSKLDVAQASTIYYSTEASIPSIKISITVALNSLAILIGEFPEHLSADLTNDAPIPAYSKAVGIGVPMDILRRRPDIAQAEFQLSAQAAALGVAKKDYFPSLSITGSIGFSSHDIGDLPRKRSMDYSIAPRLTWTIFDGFARNAAVASARENMMASIDNYNLSVITAIEEVENALTRYSMSLQAIESLSSVVENAKEAFDLSLDLYKQGLTGFTEVADAQINLLQYTDQLVITKGTASRSLINLYEALGGGWTIDNIN